MVGALRTLQGWYAAPDWRGTFVWDPHHPRRERVVVGRAFDFHYQGWEVQLLTWQAYSKSLRQSFEEQLLENEKQARELAESMGLIRARRQYSTDNLEWFALYQFAGLSSKEIADRYAAKGKVLQESAVLKGIKAAAKLVGWNQLRKPRQTRNRKTR